jgi:hypothetical protein
MNGSDESSIRTPETSLQIERAAEDPNLKIQTPEKAQAPNSNRAAAVAIDD